MTVHDLVVIGGGIGGLTVAWEAARAGRDVVVLESDDQIGGMLRRGTIAGVGLDVGAESFAIRTSGVADLVADARLPVQLVEPRRGGAHLAFRGAFGRTRRAPLPRRALIGLPADPTASDVVRILGRGGARRAAQERALPGHTGDEPSLAALATARFGPAVTARLVEPLCRSVYSQDAGSVRLSALHPALWAEFLVRGSLTAAVDALAPASQAGSAVRGVEGGLWRLATELQAAALRAGAAIRTGAHVTAVSRSATAVEVSITGAPTLAARDVVIATGPAAAARLLGVDITPADPVRLTVAEIVAPALAARPIGSGVIVAPDVATPAKALTHVDAKWDWPSAALPPGSHVVRLSARDAAAGGLDDEAGVARAVRTLTGVAVSSAAVRSVTAVTWPDAVCPPAARTALLAAATPGIHIAGAVAAGTGLASVIPHARALAADLIARPTPHEGERHVR